jgi:hypothetical protein
MRVLLIESVPGAGHPHAVELEASGHAVARCHDPGAPAFPCAGVERGCPIDTGPLDVALAVRSASAAEPSGGEQGVTCALRHRIPVVVADAGHPYGARVDEAGDDVVAACESVAAAPRTAHAAAVRAAVEDDPRLRAAAIGVAVDVRRRAPDLAVRVWVPAGLEEGMEAAVANRAATAARRFDPGARIIDVSVSRA